MTGDPSTGIRNYDMSRSPLNYSDVGYDLTGPQVHADGEIWSATNFDIRQALIAKYDKRFPAGDAGLQRRCADGQLPADRCPGNRRWIQILFDAYLLMPSQVSMVDARDAYLAADRMRFGGANQAALWNAFARRGLGDFAHPLPCRVVDVVGALAVPLDRALDTADTDEIGADAEDHARPRSIATRMVFTAPASPHDTASPIRKWPMLSSTISGNAAIASAVAKLRPWPA